MKMAKKRMCVFLAVLLVIAGLSMTSWASDATSGTCGENVTWEFNDGTLTISGTGAMTDYETSGDMPWSSWSSEIETIEIGKGITRIGDNAFFWCKNLTGVTIPDTVTSIGDSAFYDCSSLANMELPDGIVKIGFFTFGYCESLTELTLPGSLNEMDAMAFYGCSGLTQVSVDEGVTVIGASAFRECSSLESISIPSTVTAIGGYAFSGCQSLETINIPASVTSIGGSVFADCQALDGIWVDEDNAFYASDENGVLFSKDKTQLIQMLSSYTGEYTIPETVEVIGYGAFSGCSGLTGVDIPDGVTCMKNNAFMGCENLVSVEIPGSVTEIGASAFWGCVKLTEIEIPSGVTDIGSYVFNCCFELKKVIISDTVAGIGEFAFGECESLEGIWVDAANQNFSSDENGVLYDKDKTVLLLVPETWSGSYNIPKTVTTIGTDAFGDCKGLTGVTIPGSVTTIDMHAFISCESLTSVIIPKSVTGIGSQAFDYCDALTEIKFGGDAPDANGIIFENVTATAYYPKNNDTWTAEVMENMGGNITWVPYDPDSLLEMTAALGVADLAGFPCTGGYGANSNVQIQVTESGTYTLTYNGSIGSETSLGYLMIDLIDAATLLDEYYLGLELKDLTLKADGVKVAVDFDAILTGDLEGNGNWRIEVVNMERGLDGSEAEDSVADRVNFNETLEVTFTIAPIRQCGDDAWWDLKDGVLTIYGTGAMYDFDADYITPWIKYNDRITSVVVEDGITDIGIAAFNSLTNLTEVTLGKNVETIGNVAFARCTSLSEVSLNDGLQTIGEFAFGSSALTEITIPGTVSDMTASVFQDCVALKKVVFEDGVTSVGGQTFDGCTALQLVAIPGTAKTITTSLFNNCTNLTEVILGEGIEEISYSAFNGCTGLKTVNLPDSLTTLWDQAFQSCTGLASIIIPENVTYMGGGVFKDCANLTEIFFKGKAPSNVSEDDSTLIYPSLDTLTATAYYFEGDSWTEEQQESYGGTITWVKQAGILSGEDEVFDVSDAEEVAVRVDYDYTPEVAETIEVRVNGEIVDPSNYTVTQGSVIITFKEAFLHTLEHGVHTVTIYFERETSDGVASSAAVSTLTVLCGHTGMTKVSAAAPDCEHDGNNLYYICDCGKVFKADGVTETTVEAEVISALGHQMDTEWTTVNEVHGHICTREGCDHVEDSASCFGGEATCEKKAVCSVCGESYGELGAHVPGPAATEDAAQTCTVCGEELSPKLEHVHVDDDGDGKCDGCGYQEETTTEETTTEEMTAEETTAEETTTEETTAEETTAEETTTEETTAEETTAEETITEETTAEETTAEETITEETTAEETTAENSTAEESTEEDTTETPDTGDRGSMVLWSAAIMVSLAVVGTMAVFERKRKAA